MQQGEKLLTGSLYIPCPRGHMGSPYSERIAAASSSRPMKVNEPISSESTTVSVIVIVRVTVSCSRTKLWRRSSGYGRTPRSGAVDSTIE